MLRNKENRSEWLWLLFFFLTAGCELTVDNIDFERHMTDDLVNVPRTSPKAAQLGGRDWAAPYISDVRQARFRPERVCRYWHAAQAAWRMQCDPQQHEMPPGLMPQTIDDNWELYLSATETECSPDWVDLPWREVEGIAVCAELIIDSPCEYKDEWLRACLDGQLPLSSGPIRPL
jgi:hypothetical protein